MVETKASVATTKETEVTPEMIEAGCAAFALCEASDAPWSTVRDVYLAMEHARLSQQADEV